MRYFAFVLAWVAWAVATAASGADAKRPNILFAFADDWGRIAGAYAELDKPSRVFDGPAAVHDAPGTLHEVVRTPNFDRLAREGILFRHAFVSAPSCTPCRSAILTGQHFWRTGRASILRGAVWDGSQVSFPFLLRDAGYHIGKTYKVWRPGTPVDAPFGERKYAYESAGERFNKFSTNVMKLVEGGKSIEAAKQELFDEVTNNFDSFLKARPAGAPFCYWFGPTNTHRAWAKGSGRELWGIDSNSLQEKLPPYLADVRTVREDLADYLGEIQAFDSALGKLRERLEAIGELDNTLIVVSGDHGPPGFPHGKCNLYDFGTSVPLVIRWGGAKGDRVIDDLISLTDLAPTFLDLAGLKIPRSMTGYSLVSLLNSTKAGLVDAKRDAVFTGRERHVDDARADFAPYPQRAIRTRDFLYIINFKPDRWPLGDPFRLDGDNPPTIAELTDDTRATLRDEDAGPAKAWLVKHANDPQWKRLFAMAYGKRPREELYQLSKDPHQMNNIAEDPTFDVVRKKLYRQLMSELVRTGDPRVVDDGKYFETPPLAGPAEDPAAKK